MIFPYLPRTVSIDAVVRKPETIFIDQKQALCHGAGASGHPGVYLNLGAEGRARCPYCGQVFRNHLKEP